MVASVRSDYGMGIGKVVIDKDTNSPKISQKVAGLDIDDYISAVQEARKAQEKPYQDKIDKNTKTLAALSTFQTKLKAVQDLAKTMANRISSTQPRVTNNVFQQHGVMATTSTGQNYTDIVNISASESALLGSFSMQVNQLASSDMKKGTIRATAMNQNLNITGKFSIGTTAGIEKTIEITDRMSLADIQNAINAVSADTKVSADVSLTSIGATSTFELKLKAQGSGEAIVLQTISGNPLTDLGFSQTTSNKICGILKATDETTALKLNGSLTIGTQGGGSESISLTDTMSLSDIVAAINQKTSSTGVTASYDLAYYSTPSKYQIKLEATTGNTVIISDTNEMANALGLNVPVADFNDLCAKVIVDGSSYKKRSNTISDIINGVTLNLQSASPAIVQGAVIEDKDQFANTFIEFMGAWNDLNSFYNDQTKTKTNPDGKSIAAAEGADLYGNTYARSAMSALKSVLTGQTAGVSLATKESSSTTALTIMGIKMQPDGSIKFENDTDFSTAISNSYSDIKKLLTNTVSVSNSDLKVIDMPTKLPASIAGKPITVQISKNSTGEVTATLMVNSVAYPVTATTSGGSITIAAIKDSEGKGTPIEGIKLRFDGNLTDNNSISIEIKSMTQGPMARLDNEFNNILDENVDATTGKKKGTIFVEIENYDKKNASQQKIIDKIEANAKTEAARLEKEFKSVYEATIQLENIMSMIDSFNKANR